MSIKEQIIKELERGDRFASELKDAAAISYKELWAAIEQLKAEGKVITYFRETPPSATLTFTLPKRVGDTNKYWWSSSASRNC